MKTIKTPSSINVELLEEEILELYPVINKKKKNLSRLFTERILIMFNEMRKSIQQNEQLFLKDRLPQGSVPYAQICKKKRVAIFSKSTDSAYTDAIQEEILMQYLGIAKYDHPEYGEVDFYVTGKLCKQYYFLEKPEEFIKYELTTKEALAIAETLKKEELKHKKLSDEQNHVRQQIIKNTEQIQMVNNHSSRATLRYFLKMVETTPKEFLEIFNTNENRTITDDFGYRLHHKLTCLKKTFKKYLSVNNEQLMELDITNSQPFIASIISKDLLYRLSKDSAHIKELLPLVPVIEKYQEKKDFKQYRELCYKGELYEFLLKKHNIDYGKSIERGRLKKIVFKSFFSDFSKHHLRSEEEKKRVIQLIRKCFPSLYFMLKEIQSVNLKLKLLEHPKLGQESRKNTPLLMSRVESEVMFNHIIPRVVERGIWCSTIHDSIILKNRPNEAEMVEKIMIDTFNDLEIIPPKIKKK